MIMSSIVPGDSIAAGLFREFTTWPIFDPHSHINPQAPAARSLDQILGYHYYTELAHSAGMPADEVAPHQAASHQIRAVARYLSQFDNTVQHAWLAEIARSFHGIDRPIDKSSIDILERQCDKSSDPDAWDAEVWRRTNLEAVFLTNEFDDPLTGWDTSRYIPCLRTDDLVLKLHQAPTLERLQACTNESIGDEPSLRRAIGKLFQRFVANGARACAISLPPDFVPRAAAFKRSASALRRALRALPLRPEEHDDVRVCVFWMLAEFCADFKIPFDLMIGPVRNTYTAGVAGGRDLFDRRVSLRSYADLFNHFAGVKFPVSTLSPDAAAELVAFAWIFPNVFPMGHWWYSNIPAFIEPDLRSRLQAVPKSKLIGYYSDAYKLEFILPKFNMYRRALSEVLARMIRDDRWTETQAVETARFLLIDNPKRLFPPAPTSAT